MENCKCYVWVDTDPKKTKIVQCPLHAAAGKLLTALKNLVNDFDETVQTKDPMLVEARAAIAEAEQPFKRETEKQRQEPIDRCHCGYRANHPGLCQGRF